MIEDVNKFYATFISKSYRSSAFTFPIFLYILYKFYETYSVANANAYFVKNMLLLENPQFSPNHYETLTQ